MMEVIEQEAIDTKKAVQGATAKTLRGPELTQEQREWLNRVFIPNFRAELLRTLKPEDLVPNNGRRGREARAKDGGGTPPRQPAGTPALPAAKPDGQQPAGAQGPVSSEPDGAQSGGADEETQRAAELEAENKRLRAALAETRVDRELVWAAASRRAINPAQVAHLMKDRVRLDKELEPIVVNAQGDRAYDRYGRPVTVADAVRTFLEENPHMVRPSMELAGGGSGGTDATLTARRVAAVTGGDLIEEALREGE